MMRIVGRVLYWLLVLVVSAVLVFALIRFFDARDESQLEQEAFAPASAYPALTSAGLRST